jgi:hypothetical protein
MNFMRIKGSHTGTLICADGRIEVHHKDNIILQVGFDFIADAIGRVQSRPEPMAYTAIGIGTSSPTPEQTTLDTELFRKVASYHHDSGTKEFLLKTTFEAGEGTGAITEAGICNAVSGGIFLDRVCFADDVIHKGVRDVFESVFRFVLSGAEDG